MIGEVFMTKQTQSIINSIDVPTRRKRREAAFLVEPNKDLEQHDNINKFQRLDEMPVDGLTKHQNGYPPGGKTFTELDGDMRLDCVRLFDYSCCLGFLSSFTHASGIAIDLGINDKNQEISKLASEVSINTQANRRKTVKALKICLSAIRDNEMLFLETFPEFMRCSEQVALGLYAIKVIGEVIDMLASIY
jgi:hypothetical protein